ncbi:M15 family metallopeptidase [Enterococcus mundtii]|uniref:M15 family metallopeptidase n=1 Tax=Enterococcus mundtii TaxID=53346 RepID=A0A848MTR8_ENTMU|nr:M15 family metallopeptidase [Enterococcus mundtii]NMP58274.1 M15 family metallopeptidase [Enterococcus mundtii]
MEKYIFFVSLLIVLTGCTKIGTERIDANKDKINESMLLESTTENEEDVTLLSDVVSYLVLVNKEKGLPSTYMPDDLVVPQVLNVDYQVSEAIMMRREAAQMLEKLFQTATNEAGYTLLAVSGFRSYEAQAKLYNEYVQTYGQIEADRFSAQPGHSEHQTGLAMDVTSESVTKQLDQTFGETPEGQWLEKNAHRFGYIIRYPEGREQDTGYMYEPWHVRYVGVEPATEITEKGLILEEYLAN